MESGESATANGEFDARGSPNETTPLVGDTQSECSDSDSSRDESAAEETRELLSFTLPVSAAYLLSYLAQATSMVFLGHLGAMELAAGCLAITFGNVAGFSMLIGLATAADTLCAQAWTMKSDDPHAVGEILQQSLLVMFVACVPTCLAFWFAGPILLALGQDKDVVALASEFLRILIPAVPAFGAFESIKRFLQSQGVASAYTAVIFATTILNVPLTYVLVWRALGFVGAPIAIAAVAWANLLLILLYARFVDGAQGFGGWSREAVRWRALKAYLKLALPGVLQVASEWWTFEVLAIMAGLLGSRELAVQSVVTTITSLIFMLPLGLSVSTTTRVAQKLGANRPQRSQMASLCGLGLGSAFGLVAMAVLLVFRHQLGGLLTSDPDVIAAVGDVLLVAAFYELADAINCVAAGVLRGVAATGYAAAAAFVGYYVVGLPLSGVLAFGPPALGLRGIWIGITGGIALSMTLQLAAISTIDFEAEVLRTKKRLLVGEKPSALFSPGLGSTILRNGHSGFSADLNFTFRSQASIDEIAAAAAAAFRDPGAPSIRITRTEPVPTDRILTRTAASRFTASPLVSPTLFGWASFKSRMEAGAPNDV